MSELKNFQVYWLKDPFPVPVLVELLSAQMGFEREGGVDVILQTHMMQKVMFFSHDQKSELNTDISKGSAT